MSSAIGIQPRYHIKTMLKNDNPGQRTGAHFFVSPTISLFDTFNGPHIATFQMLNATNV
jgi:hypothetical protein